MIVRVRSRSTGALHRIEIDDSATLAALVEKICRAFAVKQHDLALSSTPSFEESIRASDLAGKPLKTLGIKHGELLFVDVLDRILDGSKCPVDTDLDLALSRQDAQIRRERDPRLCRHGDSGRCEHCVPLDPWDEAYLKEKGIKHLSFHAHLRKLKPTGSGGQTLLEQPFYGLKPNCPYHAPYPEGICTKCQPSAVTLTSQSFRMVDHVEFADAGIVERFIEQWRKSGHQHYGVMLGRWERYEAVPLGIKAVVEAVYVVSQDSSPDGFRLLDDPHYSQAVHLATLFGLQPIGMMYTDLLDAGSGKVRCKRNADTFFVSSAETLFMARQQLEHKFWTSFAKDGTFGSRFVTAIITGDFDQNINLNCYQISITGEALLAAGLIEASTDPAVILAKQSAASCTPEIFYVRRNEYGREVKLAAKPSFPVDYLLVSLTHGFPMQPRPLFSASLAFPSVHDDPSVLDTAMRGLRTSCRDDNQLLRALSSFNATLFLFVSNMLTEDDLRLLVHCSTNASDASARRELFASQSWQALVDALMRNSSPALAPATSAGERWACEHCTFINGGARSDCEMCTLPRDGH